MLKENFLVNINTIFLLLARGETSIYSIKLLEKIYNIDFDFFTESNLDVKNFLKDEEKSKNLINIILSIINLNQNNLDKNLKSFLKLNLLSSEEISNRINLILNKVSLSFKINDLNEPNLEKNSKSFADSIWISLSEILSDKYLLKMCCYGKCELIFISRRKSSSYCNSKCQTRAKSFRAYHSNDQVIKIINKEKGDQLEEIIPTKLKPEKYIIPNKYDVDFGFFDDEQTKIRLLGS